MSEAGSFKTGLFKAGLSDDPVKADDDREGIIMSGIRFPAVLESEDGNIIEYGYAELASDPNSINFTGGFIPLYRIGEKVTVVRLLNGKRLDTLRGKVFLSSKNLLRVTDIDEASIARIRSIFSSNTRFRASLGVTEERKRFRIRPRKDIYRVDAIIYHVSCGEIRFLSMDPISRGRKLILDLDRPFTAKGIVLSVRSVVDFGNIMDAYICDIVSAPQESLRALKEYAASLSE